MELKQIFTIIIVISIIIFIVGLLIENSSIAGVGIVGVVVILLLAKFLRIKIK